LDNAIKQRKDVDVLAAGDGASGLAEEAGDTLGGCAGEGLGDIILTEGVQESVPRDQIAWATQEDESLKVVRDLADLQREGYFKKDGIILRSRMDALGSNINKICLPSPYRQKCLALAHTQFGHQGRNKMVTLIRNHFYWPTMSRDIQTYLKSCNVFQKTDKSNPPHSPMQLREAVCIPFERVAIDLVGQFPSASGGFRFLLTCVNLATRWPEAIPLKCTTARVIINQLTNIFCRWANWAKVVPMAICFIRCSLCDAKGLSLFMARQGWEPNAPLQLPYKSWAETDLGDVNLE